MRVVAGAPVCPVGRLPEVAAEFEHEAAQAGDHVCYFGAEARLESIYPDSSKRAKVLLGAQPVWQPHSWHDVIASRASLRAQLNRGSVSKRFTQSRRRSARAANTVIKTL